MKKPKGKYHKFSRRYVILIEVLIAMGLMMLIMATLLLFYNQVSRLNQQQEIEQKENFRKLYLSTRLAAVIPKAIAFSDAEGDSFFYTSMIAESSAGKSLVLAYDNGVKLTPEFSNHVIGRLYVNSMMQLCLATWPSPKRWNDSELPAMKEEVLLEGVEGVKFKFYVPPGKDRSIILSQSKKKMEFSPSMVLDLEGGWRDEWQQEWGDLPVLVKIGVHLKDGNSISLAYHLANSHLILLYDR